MNHRFGCNNHFRCEFNRRRWPSNGPETRLIFDDICDDIFDHNRRPLFRLVRRFLFCSWLLLLFFFYRLLLIGFLFVDRRPRNGFPDRTITGPTFLKIGRGGRCSCLLRADHGRHCHHHVDAGGLFCLRGFGPSRRPVSVGELRPLRKKNPHSVESSVVFILLSRGGRRRRRLFPALEPVAERVAGRGRSRHPKSVDLSAASSSSFSAWVFFFLSVSDRRRRVRPNAEPVGRWTRRGRPARVSVAGRPSGVPSGSNRRRFLRRDADQQSLRPDVGPVHPRVRRLLYSRVNFVLYFCNSARIIDFNHILQLVRLG